MTAADIELNPVTFVVVLVACHFGNIFFAWLLHFMQHRRVCGLPLDVIHFKAHHDRMLARTDPRTFRRYMVLGHAVSLSMIGLLFLLYVWIFTPWVAVTLIVHGMLMGGFLYYSHREYHKRRSWLCRFQWFRRGRTLHRIHHGRSENFARSGNYGIGEPVTGQLMDVVLGTIRTPWRRSLSRKPRYATHPSRTTTPAMLRPSTAAASSNPRPSQMA